MARDVTRRIRGTDKKDERSDDDERPKELKSTSRDMYRGRMNTIVRLMGWEDGPGDPVKRVMTTPGAVAERLAEAYEELSTMANMVTTVLAYFKRHENVRFDNPKAFEAWRKLHAVLKDRQRKRYEKNEPSAKQAENYVSFREMEAMARRLEADSRTFMDARRHFQWLLMTVLSSIKPKRSDLGNVRLIDKAIDQETRAELDARNMNYVDIQSGQLVLNEFTKTNDTYERIVEQIPKGLIAALRKSLKAFPRKYLFVSTRTLKPYVIPNSYAQFVRRTFAELFDGRSAGVTLVRHAYVNEKIDFNKMSLEDRERVANSMGHSVTMQGLYKWVNVPGQKDADTTTETTEKKKRRRR